MKYRFVAERRLGDGNKEDNSAQQKVYLDAFPEDFTSYSSVTLEREEGSGFKTVGKVICSVGPDVRIVTSGYEYQFKTNIFCMLIQKQIDWDTIAHFALGSKSLK